MLKAKFKINQKVYAVSSKSVSKREHVECDVCNSTGRVKINGRDNDYVCPVCRGETKTVYDGFEYVISYYEASIGKVQIEEYAARYDYESRVTYMLKETGVGSGTIWREDRLFATEEEAKEFCEKYVPSDYYDRHAILKD